ncbi:MAG: hypothetical protein ACRDO1_18045, partial [Nocardioidaceae bacterium]
MAKSRFRPSEIPGVGKISARVDRAIRWRVEEGLRPLRDRLDSQERRIRELEGRLRALEGEPAPARRTSAKRAATKRTTAKR